MLEAVVRDGAQRMLQRALQAEVEEFLGQAHSERRVSRLPKNGHLPKRTIGVGMGAVEVRVSRVSEVPADIEPFTSEIVRRGERRCLIQARLLSRLHLEGLSSGDFEPGVLSFGG
jgi:hypothetical protein